MKQNFALLGKNKWMQRAILGMLYLWNFAVLAQAPKTTYTLDPQKKLTQYVLDQWTTQDGLPSNNIRRLKQTKDGFLWMSGFDGLVNFDGVRFTTFNKRNIQNLTSSSFYAMEESANGVLWIGSEGNGLFQYKQNAVRKIGLDNFFITSIFIESEQRFWISGRNEGIFLFNPKTGIIQPFDYSELSKVSIYSIKKDKKGVIWFGSDGKGLTSLENNRFFTYTVEDGLPSNNIIELFFDSKGTLWVGTTEGLAYLDGEQFIAIPELKKDIVYRVVEDRHGSLWIASSAGLYRKNGLTGAFELYPYIQESPLTNVSDVLLDPEGSLWIATYRNGLFRLKDGKFTNYTYQDGLAATSVGSICELSSNQYLIGMNNGKINLIQDGKISLFPIKTTLPDVRVFNILKDRNGNIWICAFDKLVKILPNGTEKVFTKENGLPDKTIRVAFEDEAGNIWIGTRWGGVAKIDKNNQITILNTKKGLSSNFIMSIREDLEGNIWISTNDAGINIISPKGKITKINSSNGLVSNIIFNTYTDSKGITWVATNGGLSRIERGNITNFTVKEGLLSDNLFDVIEDKTGHFWMPNSKGVMKVSKKDLNNFAYQKIEQIEWIEYNRHDGMKSEDCTGAAHSIQASDGKIWIPTNGGVLVVDPQNIPLNHLKPLLRINHLTIDNKPVDIHKPIIINPNKVRVVFDYSALSLLASPKVRFKYRLVGFDEDWIEAGSNRQAVYTNLPSGEFTFRVIACNNDGVWNEVGASLKMSKKPYFYQKTWFYLLLLLLALSLISTIFRWRIYAIQQRKRELEWLVEMKTAEISQQNKALAMQKDEISFQKKLVEKRNENILNSINYAKRIQEAILPPKEEILSILPDSFVLFKPKDIVSGDFYWVSQVSLQEIAVPISRQGDTGENRIDRVEILWEKTDKQHFANLPPGMVAYSQKIVVAAVDCTGHGVPGAFMSMIGNDLLNEIVNLRKITEPDKILYELNLSIHKTLKQYENTNRDGMDLAICTIDLENQVMEFSGAKNPIFYIQNGKLTEIKGDKIPIGGFYKDESNYRHFSRHTIPIHQPTWVYLFSDGFQDQFGELTRKKFSRHRIRELLLEVHQKPFEEQKHILWQTIQDWAGNEEQIDDILALGFKVG